MKTELVTIIQIATCFLNVKKYQEAENILKKYSNNGPSPELYFYLGLSYTLQGKYNEAIDALSIHLSSSHESESARELIFQLLINKAQSALANAEYTVLSDVVSKAITFLPDNGKYAKILSHFENVMPVSYIKNGEREKAAKIWIDELKKNSFSNPDTIHNLALLYYWWAISNEQEILNGKDTEKNKKRDLADYLWSKTFLYWFSFINSESFWGKLCETKSQAWKSDVTLHEVSVLKAEISRNKILKVLEEFQDKYRQSAMDEDFNRVQSYITSYFFEKKTASYWTDFQGLLRNNRKLFESDLHQKVDEIIQLQGPYSLSFINEYLFDQKLIEKILTFTSQKLQSDKDSEICENIQLFYNFPICGKILIAIKELKNYEYALSLWNGLKEIENIQEPGPSKKSFEAQYLLALIHFEKGNHFLNIQEFSNAFQEWTIAYETTLNAFFSMDKGKAKNCKTLLANLKNQLSKTVSEECIKYAKKLNVANKIDEAIEILQIGYKMAKNDLIVNLLCSNYCEKAHPFSKVKNYEKANEFFEKALKLDNNYSAAIKGLSISKNNEGLAALNNGSTDKAIKLLEKAYELDKDDVVEENLASAYNQKAVKILNDIGSYSSHYQCDPALELIKKGVKLLNPQLEVESITSTFQFYEEYQFNSMVSNLKDDLYKTMLHNLWVAARTKRNLRGY